MKSGPRGEPAGLSQVLTACILCRLSAEFKADICSMMHVARFVWEVVCCSMLLQGLGTSQTAHCIRAHHAIWQQCNSMASRT